MVRFGQPATEKLLPHAVVPLLPLADVQSVKVTDSNRMVLTCHLFASGGTDLGVATHGRRGFSPPPRGAPIRRHRMERRVGDKGGKKDKEKSKHQHDAKVKKAAAEKQEKNRPKVP